MRRMLHSRRAKIFIAFVLIVVAGYALARFGLSSRGASVEFTDARAHGAVISQEIVNLSNEISGALGRVSELDRERKTSEALALTLELLEKNQEIKNRAIELSRQLERMTSGLAQIRSAEARQAALDSITGRLTIISRLVSYSDYLSQLLLTLRSRFSGGENETLVASIIHQINAEVTAINNFNREAVEAMERFDSIVNK